MSNWSRVYLIRKIAGILNNLQYKVCTKERVSRLAWICLYLAGGCEFERSSDTWKRPTMAPAGLRGQIEMVLKKILFPATVVGLQGRKGRESRDHGKR